MKGSIFILLIIMAVSCSSELYAQNTANSAPLGFVDINQANKKQNISSRSAARIRIRLVQANDYEKNPQKAHSPRAVAHSLIDVAKKLLKLPYRSFTLLDDQEISLNLTSEDSIELSNNSIIQIKPLSFNKDKVCLWINWKDSARTEVIDSQMHFDIGESMVIGADQSDKQGMILIVDVSKDN